jgi:hypothetical protein
MAKLDLSTPSNPVFLRPSEFVTLATSRQKLVRADDPRLGIRGLVDPETGTRYFVEDSRLRRS